MSDLLIRAGAPDRDGSVTRITPASAGWTYVGFEVLGLAAGAAAVRETDGVEACLVAVAGGFEVKVDSGETGSAPGRPGPFGGLPDAVYLPPGHEYTVTASVDAEVAICTAPAEGRFPLQELPGSAINPETRGYGRLERTIHPILMGDLEAESLLVCEVKTPAGNWSSFPPHKHDRDNLPEETFLEETYYHRIEPQAGFALQRVYTGEGDLDESMAVPDRGTVLVPRGYHTVSAPPGYDNYYLNVMAGPHREWLIHNDPAHEWLLDPERGA